MNKILDSIDNLVFLAINKKINDRSLPSINSWIRNNQITNVENFFDNIKVSNEVKDDLFRYIMRDIPSYNNPNYLNIRDRINERINNYDNIDNSDNCENIIIMISMMDMTFMII